MVIIDGKQTSLQIQDELSIEVQNLVKRGEKTPHLAAVLVGDDGASITYVNAKVKACERVGFKSSLIRLSNTISQEEIAGLARVYSFYVKFPESRWNEIKVAEKFNKEGDAMFEKLGDEFDQKYRVYNNQDMDLH